MRDLKGNPFAARAESAETSEDAQAIVNAILAVAYEQRTSTIANLAANDVGRTPMGVAQRMEWSE